jgi:murein L,D-transpeptidase YcbB/YkuD
VRLTYATAAVADDGRLLFRPDRYLRDPRLDAALRNRP